MLTGRVRVALEVRVERLQSLWREGGATLPLLRRLRAAELHQALCAQPVPAGRAESDR